MKPEMIVIAHNLRSSHNVGSLLRTCEGLAVKKLILTGYTPYPLAKNDQRLPHLAEKISRQIKKTALGAEKSQNWSQNDDLQAVIDKLREEGYVLCALEQSPQSIPINRFMPPAKIALILGNEVSGLDDPLLQKVDHILEIPMFGKKESFNVVQAAAMALYALRFGS